MWSYEDLPNVSEIHLMTTMPLVSRILRTLCLCGSLALVGGRSYASEEPPEFFFLGRVCHGTETLAVREAAKGCRKPLSGVTVIIVNSDGRAYLDFTDKRGRYSLPRIPLYGTDNDQVIFAGVGYVQLSISPLAFDPEKDTDRGENERVTVHLRTIESTASH